MGLIEELFVYIIIVTISISIFFLTWYFVRKKSEKKEVKVLKEKLLKQEILTDQLREERQQQQFNWDDRFARQTFEIQQLQKDNEQQLIKDELLQEKYNKELHFRKSSEVRLGKIGENLAPFLNGWPWNARHFRFLGNPVDGVQFTDDEIIFVEIKTGKAVLSKIQKKTKELIKAGKVSFVTFKITDDGTKLIKEN
jgi:predicted Holliday junction resolvase-like endonuclease